jgi:hypothetical protein
MLLCPMQLSPTDPGAPEHAGTAERIPQLVLPAAGAQIPVVSCHELQLRFGNFSPISGLYRPPTRVDARFQFQSNL